MVKPGRLLAQSPQPLLLTVAALILRILRHFHAHPFGKGPHGIGIGHPLNLHLEIDDAAALVTAKAVVNSLFRTHGEGGSFLSMERAQAKQIGAGAL